MRLTPRRSVRAEDRFETWLAQRYQKEVLESGVTAPGPCPDEAFLRDLARKASRISLSHPMVDHAASCPKCMSRLLAFREEDPARVLHRILAGGEVGEHPGGDVERDHHRRAHGPRHPRGVDAATRGSCDTAMWLVLGASCDLRASGAA